MAFHRSYDSVRGVTVYRDVLKVNIKGDAMNTMPKMFYILLCGSIHFVVVAVIRSARILELSWYSRQDGA